MNRSGWVRDVSVIVGGSVVGQVAVVVVLPITSRLFSPAELGAFGVFLALATVLYGFAALRFDAAITVADEESVSVDVLRAALRAAIGIGVLTTVVALIAADSLAEVVGIPVLERWLWLIGPTVVAASWFLTAVFWHTRQGSFRTISVGRTVQGVVLAAGQVLVGVAGLGVEGLLLVPLASWVVALAAIAAGPMRAGLLSSGTGRVGAAAIRYRRFPLFGTWSVVCNRLSSEIAPAAIAALHGPRIAGLYLVASRAAYRPVGIVSRGVSQVYLHRAAPLWRRNPSKLRPMLGQVSRNLVLVAAVPAVMLIVLGPWLFELTFGARWREAGVYAALLVPMVLASAASTALGPTFTVTERQDLQLYREVAHLVMVVGAFAAAAVLDLSPRWTVAAYGGASTVGYALLLVTIWHAARPAPAVRAAEPHPV